MYVTFQQATNHVCLNIQNDGEDSTSNKWSTKFMLGEYNSAQILIYYLYVIC